MTILSHYIHKITLQEDIVRNKPKIYQIDIKLPNVCCHLFLVFSDQ